MMVMRASVNRNRQDVRVCVPVWFRDKVKYICTINDYAVMHTLLCCYMNPCIHKYIHTYKITIHTYNAAVIRFCTHRERDISF